MDRPRSSAGGGVLVALGALGGAALGFVLREPTLWFLVGLAAGALAAVILWLRDRR